MHRSKAIPLHDVEFTLDTPEAIAVGPGEYILKGWCFSRIPGDVLNVRVRWEGGEVAAFLGLPRPDVAAAFRDAAITSCGFVARFQAYRFQEHPGVRGLSLVVVRNGIEFHRVDGIRLGADVIGWEREPLSSQPLLTVVVATDGQPAYFLKRCMESVLEQDYERWQLCVSGDEALDEAAFATLQEYARADSRIRWERSMEAQGRAAACNTCLKNADGDFVVVLQDGDELHPGALREIARSMEKFPEARLFYSDEVVIDGAGGPGDSWCKPEFDQEILLSLPGLASGLALKRDLANGLGGWRPAMESGDDWDLFIRASETLPWAAVKRIGKPLYRRRSWGSRPDRTKIWTSVLEDHIERTGKQARVREGLFAGSMRLQYEGPREVDVAAFLRPEDGAFQEQVVKLNSGRRVVNVYRTGEPASEEVFVFFNGRIESLNHLFFEELVAQSCRPDCGRVTGISRNGEDGQGLEVVRRLADFDGTFFAVRRERLDAADGLAILFTPYAVATFTAGGGTSMPIAVREEEAVEIRPEQRELLAEERGLQEENERLAAVIRSIEKSLSWRVTKPLRAAMRAWRGRESS